MKLNTPYSAVIGCLFVGIICINIAQHISIPFLALYLANKSNCSIWMNGLAIGVAPFCSIFGGFLGGQLSDKYGRVLILYYSVFSTSLIFILFYFAFQINNSHQQWIIIVLLNAFFGLFTAFFQPSVMALLTDLVDKKHREQIFHLRYAAINIGAVIGPLIGVFLGITLSPIAFLIGGIIYIGYGFVLYKVLNKTGLKYIQQHHEVISILDSIHRVFTDKKLLHFILFHLIFAICYSQTTSTLAYHIAKNISNSTRVYSLVITLNALCVLVGQVPIYLLCKNIAKNKVIWYGCITFFLGCVGFSYSGSKEMYFYFSMMIITVGELLIFPFASAFIDNMAPPHLKGTYFGAVTFRELGLALGPIVGGSIFQNYGGPVLFLIIGLLSLCSYYFVVLCERSKNEEVYPIASLDKGV